MSIPPDLSLSPSEGGSRRLAKLWFVAWGGVPLTACGRRLNVKIEELTVRRSEWTLEEDMFIVRHLEVCHFPLSRLVDLDWSMPSG